MVNIDESICIGCGVCKKDCPGSAIDIKEAKAVIVRKCIQCGHCVAICPVRAVSIPEYEMEDVEEYSKGSFCVEADAFLRAVKFRRSIRNYKAEKIEQEKINRVLNAGRYTATAKNMQECTFVLVQEELYEFKELVWNEMPEILKVLKETIPDYAKVFQIFYRKWKKNNSDDTFFFNAPAFLVVASANPLDGGLAAANIENMAVAEGLGALYSGYMMKVLGSSPKLMEWLGIKDRNIACCMLLGYPNVEYKRTAPRRKADIIWK